MKRLVNCLDKLVGKLITKADADLLVSEARAYEQEGYSPAESEKMAVADAIEDTESTGQSVLDQIQQSVPQALPAAQEYWGREAIRKVGAPFEKEARATPEAPVERPVLQAAPPAQPEAVAPEVAPPVTPEAAPPAAPPEAAPPAPEAVTPPAAAQPVLPGFREPLTTAQRAMVDSLPEAQRPKMEQAFQVNPFPDPHQPLPKKAPTILPERNKAIPELSKYGVLDPDATTQSILENIAADKSLPKWMRTIMDLLVQVGNLGNVEIEAVYLPGSNWPALYANRQGTSKIYINLAKNLPPGGLARTVAHEVLHHMTMMKLMDRVLLNDTEAQARDELNRIFEHIQGLPEFADEYGARNPWEFASDVFSNESLRAKLNALSLPGSKLTLMQQIRRLLAALGFGGKEIRAGSMLEEAMRQTMRVAGTTAVTGEGTAAMSQGSRARFMRVLNEFPQFQNEIINATAPIEYDMGITAEERVKDFENAHYTDEERTAMSKSLDEALAKKGWKLSPQERAKWDDKIAKRVKGTKALSPQSEGWAQHLIHPSKILLTENKKGERGAKVEWVKAPYTFDQEKGKGLKTGSPEWQQRAEDLAVRGVEDLQTRIMVGENPLATPEEKKAASVILDQIGWYRSVMDHIRHSYGGMSDMFADLLGTFSPQTQVKQNWEYGIQALKKTMEGDYDELLSRVDKWMKEDPTRTIDGWKALHKKNPEKAMILKENDKLFGQNSIHGMKALLDFWRIVQTGSAPKARNFTANLIGHSYKATIDLWAARFLQRMHLPNYRIPTIVEGDVTGAHMKNVEQISGQFGLGQEVFKRMAEKLRAENPSVWGEVSPADLQAIMWYGEKHVWETKKWTRILGASNSMKAMSEAEAVNRYELGLSRDRPEKRVTAKDQRINGMKLRNNLSGIAHTVGVKVMDTLSMFQGKKERAWDSEILVYPEYDPQEMVDYVVEVAGTSNQDATHVSRVIDTEFEKDNPNARPGITVFFREQVDFAAVQPVMAELERLKINGFTLQVDQRARVELRPEVMKKGVPDRFFGVRMQFVPEYFSTEKEAAEALPEILIGIAEAKNALQQLPNVAYINEVHYDTLVLKKGEYDTTGKLRDPAAISRAEVWRERARSVGREAATRRDEVIEQIRKTDAEATRLKREADRAEEERIAELSGGVPEEVTAAQDQEPEKEAALTKGFIGRDDEFWGITENEYVGGATFPDGRSAVECTGYSKAIQRKLGADRVKIFGFFREDNPTSEIAREAGGHDFAVVDDRYIVDPWITDVETISDKGVFDLQDPDDEGQIKRLYGDQNKWERGVTEETTAPQEQEYEEEPPVDPVSGRPSLVRAMALGEANAGGTVFAKGTFPRPGLRSAGGRAGASGGGPSPVWQAMGDALRRGEGEVHRSLERANEGLQHLIPGKERRYERSQMLFDYLADHDKEVIDPEMESEINALRERVPLIAPKAFDNFRQLQKGKEAIVFHDEDAKVVYKLFKMKEGKMGAYVPGNMVLRSDDSIGVEMGPKPTFEQFLNRVENVNNHGKIAPMEFLGVMQDGYAVFSQPFVRGQRVKSGEIEEALKRLDMKMLTDIGGIAAIGKVGDKYVLFDDLHEDNVRSLPGKRTEIIDAINRDLTPDEVNHLRKLGKLPDDIITAPQDVEPKGGFFSGVAKILNRKMPNAAPAQQVKAIIKDAPQEDIKWSGVNQAIDRLAEENKGKVPKEALLDYLRDDGAVRLEEHTLGRGERIFDIVDKDGNTLRSFNTMEEAERFMEEPSVPSMARIVPTTTDADRDQTRFAQYTIPGGENYREVVLSMPGRDQTFEEYLEASAFKQGARAIGLQGTRDGKSAEQRIDALRERYRQEYTEGKNRKPVAEYTSSHFPDVPNYVAHARMNDRTDAQGKPGLFLEEIQSDRHQAGREKGYITPTGPDEMPHGFELQHEEGLGFTYSGQDIVRSQLFKTREEAIANAQRTAERRGPSGVPDAPFRKDWPVQMFKRALRDAIASGKEWIGWTTGETQAERYDLSKQVSVINWGKNQNGNIDLDVRGLDGESITDLSDLSPDKAVDYVGKEIVKKIQESDGKRDTYGTTRGTLSGLDLKVGGEGMRGFYDKMLPSEVQKYVKQWGGKVEQGSVRADKGEVYQDASSRRWFIDEGTMDTDRSFPTEEAAKAALRGTPIWKVEITPAMKETIPVKGQSLFGAVAPQVQDDTDVVSSPLSPRGHLTRFLSVITGIKEQDGYRTEGHWKAAGKFNDLIWEAMKTKVQNGKSLITNASFLNNEYLKIVNKVYGKTGPDTAQQRTINLALGNIENRLTKAQSVTANRIRDPKLRMQYLDQAERDNITQYKAEQNTALNSLDPELRALIVKKNDLIVQMNNALLANADLSADLKEAIDKNKGTYLHRSYQIFEDNEHWKKWITGADPEAVKRVAAARTMIEGDIANRKVIEYATEELKKGKPVTRSAAYAHVRALPSLDSEITNELNSYLSVGDNPGLGAISLLGGARPGALGLSVMTERGMIRKEIQDLWGRWEDPAENFVKTYVSTGYYLENANFQRRVLDDGIAAGYIWKKGVSTEPTHPVNWKEIAPEGSKTMGVLAGAYGPPVLREAFEVMNNPVNKSAIHGLLVGITSWPLAMKTKFSTASTARNFLGNIWFVVGNGNARPGGFKSAGKTAFAEAVKKGPEAMRSYVKELTQLGVLGDNVNTQMLKEMTEFAQKNDPLTKKTMEGYAKLPDFARKAWDKYSGIHGAAYSGVDSFWKVYAYEGELAKLANAYAGIPGAPSEAELKKQAADIVRRTMPTYSEAWSGLKSVSPILRLIAPFIKFQTEVIRTSIGTLKQAKEEIGSDNPKIRKIGIKRGVMSTAMMSIAPMALAAATRALFGYDDDQEEALRASLPDWQKNATMFFLPKDEKGNAQFLDLSYMNPYKVYSNPLTALMRAMTSGKEGAIVEAASSSVAEFFRPFQAEQLWLSAWTDIHRNQDSQKNYGPLYNEQDTDFNKATAITKRFMSTMSPGDWDTMLRVKSGLAGEISAGGKEYKTGNELAAIAGFRKTTYDTAQGLQSLTARFEGDKSDAQKLLLGPLTNRGTVSPNEVSAGYEQANKQRKNLYYKMRQNYLASQKLGLTETQAISAMMIGYGSEARKTGIGKADLQSIAGGQYFRYTPSKQALAEAAAKHPDRYEAFLKAYNAAPAWEDISD